MTTHFLKEINPEYSLEGLMLKLSSNTLAIWCKELTPWKRPWCWERLKAGEGDDRGWNRWMASPTQQTWVWANCRRQWRTGKPGVLQSMGSQRLGHDWMTEQQWNPLPHSRHIIHFNQWKLRELYCWGGVISYRWSHGAYCQPDLILLWPLQSRPVPAQRVFLFCFVLSLRTEHYICLSCILLYYWVGQKVCLGFSVLSSGKSKLTFFGQPNKFNTWFQPTNFFLG